MRVVPVNSVLHIVIFAEGFLCAGNPILGSNIGPALVNWLKLQIVEVENEKAMRNQI